MYYFSLSQSLEFLPLRFLKETEKVSILTKEYREVIRSLGDEKAISIIGHSAGGRIASLLVDEPNIKQIVCFSYPFKHPDEPEGTDRTGYFANIDKPLLNF